MLSLQNCLRVSRCTFLCPDLLYTIMPNIGALYKNIAAFLLHHWHTWQADALDFLDETGIDTCLSTYVDNLEKGFSLFVHFKPVDAA